jgi:hypothetical protein
VGTHQIRAALYHCGDYQCECRAVGIVKKNQMLVGNFTKKAASGNANLGEYLRGFLLFYGLRKNTRMEYSLHCDSPRIVWLGASRCL